MSSSFEGASKKKIEKKQLREERETGNTNACVQQCGSAVVPEFMYTEGVSMNKKK